MYCCSVGGQGVTVFAYSSSAGKPASFCRVSSARSALEALRVLEEPTLEISFSSTRSKFWYCSLDRAKTKRSGGDVGFCMCFRIVFEFVTCAAQAGRYLVEALGGYVLHIVLAYAHVAVQGTFADVAGPADGLPGGVVLLIRQALQAAQDVVFRLKGEGGKFRHGVRGVAGLVLKGRRVDSQVEKVVVFITVAFLVATVAVVEGLLMVELIRTGPEPVNEMRSSYHLFGPVGAYVHYHFIHPVRTQDDGFYYGFAAVGLYYLAANEKVFHLRIVGLVC